MGKGYHTVTKRESCPFTTSFCLLSNPDSQSSLSVFQSHSSLTQDLTPCKILALSWPLHAHITTSNTVVSEANCVQVTECFSAAEDKQLFDESSASDHLLVIECQLSHKKKAKRENFNLSFSE